MLQHTYDAPNAHDREQEHEQAQFTYVKDAAQTDLVVRDNHHVEGGQSYSLRSRAIEQLVQIETSFNEVLPLA
jgi:hypothetical protein